MKTWRVVRFVVVVVAFSAIALAQPDVVVLRGGTIIDGTGHVRRGGAIEVQDGKITAVADKIELRAGTRVYDLSRLTVLPGWIDTHVHITWHFNAEGRAETRGETPQ